MFDAAMALILETADTGNEGLKPVRKFIDSITRLLKAAKDDEDSAASKLPRPEERKRIEGPRKQLEVASTTQQPECLDDEIPF